MEQERHKRWARLILVLHPILCGTLWVVSATAEESGQLQAIQRQGAVCPEGRAHCIGLVLHVTVTKDGAVQTPQWVGDQLSHANRLFAAIDVGFRLRDVRALPEGTSHIRTRKDRDLLGRNRYATGDAHVFLVKKLDNVDQEGEINGVHWRDRARRSRRWVILSSIAWELTLAHELGHFFGLPHSTYDISLMNKTPRPKPRPHERTFAPQEVKRMKRRLAKMLKNKELMDRAEETGSPH